MNKEQEKILLQQISSMELLIKVLMDEMIDKNVISYDSIVSRLDAIEQKTEDIKKESDGDIPPFMYYGPKGEA